MTTGSTQVERLNVSVVSALKMTHAVRPRPLNVGELS